MKTQLFVIIFLLSASLISSAQTTFQKTYSVSGLGSSSCFSLASTSDSGFVFAGYSYTGVASDAAVTKTNSNGVIEWSETFGDLRTDHFFSVQQTADGGYVLAGESNSFSIDSLTECFVVRLDPTGSLIWEKTYGSSSATGMTGAHSISQTSDGGFIISGYDADLNAGMIYFKTDSSGNVLWGKYIPSSFNYLGVQSIRQISDGGYIITGNGGRLFKTDSLGNISWCKSYLNGTKTYSAQETSDGGFMLAGEGNYTGPMGMDLVLVKTDSSGNLLWCKIYGGASDDYLHYAQQTSDGGYLLVGFTGSFGAGGFDIYVVKTDSAGNMLWSKAYGGTGVELGHAATEALSGGFIIAGNSESFVTNGVPAYIIHADTNGSSGCNDTTPLTVVTPMVFAVVNHNVTAVTYGPDINTPVSTMGPGLVEGLLCSNISTSVTEPDGGKNNFSIAPNPATNYFTVEFDKIINKGEIEIFDVLGARIFSLEINNESEKIITLSNIQGGIYFVKVYDGEKQECRKMIIEPH